MLLSAHGAAAFAFAITFSLAFTRHNSLEAVHVRR